MMAAIQFIVYQLVWFACAFSDVWEMPWLGPLSALAYLYWVSFDLPVVWRAAAAMGLAGAVCDTTLMHLGLISFETSLWPVWLSPAWMISLWACFSVPLITGFGWLAGKPWLAALLGGIGGPVAYAGGAEIGAMSLGDPTTSMIAIGIVWAVVTPVAVEWGQRLTQVEPASVPKVDTVSPGPSELPLSG